MMIGLHADAAEETREHQLVARNIPGAAAHEFIRYDDQQRAEFEDVPGIAPQNGERRISQRQRIAFSRDGFDQRGFTATVRPQDGYVLAGSDAESDVMEHGLFAEHDRDVVERQ